MRNSKGQFVKGEHSWRKPKPWWKREWVFDQYISCGKSASEIAIEGGVTENAILFWIHKHKIRPRTMSEVRKRKHWGASGPDNPMWNKRGEENPNWRGGCTPERQAFYTSKAWKNACRLVWKRDKERCRRCGLYSIGGADMPFHIHHIRTFTIKELRADADNLALLCEVCHHFVHSRKNTKREFLPHE